MVEDDADQVLFLGRAFAKAAPAKTPALNVCRDGEEAIAYLSGDAEYADRSTYPIPSLVLLDLKLPRKSGMDVLAWIRRDPRVGSLPVIVFSSSSEPRDLQRAYALGVNSYLVKPLDLDGLVTLARGIVAFWELNLLPRGLQKAKL